MNELDIEQLRNALNEPFRILSEAFAAGAPVMREAGSAIARIFPKDVAQ